MFVTVISKSPQNLQPPFPPWLHSLKLLIQCVCVFVLVHAYVHAHAHIMCLFAGACVCVHACMGMHVEARGQLQGSSSVALPSDSCCFATVSLTRTWKLLIHLDWLARGSRNPPVSASQY